MSYKMIRLSFRKAFSIFTFCFFVLQTVSTFPLQAKVFTRYEAGHGTAVFQPRFPWVFSQNPSPSLVSPVLDDAGQNALNIQTPKGYANPVNYSHLLFADAHLQAKQEGWQYQATIRLVDDFDDGYNYGIATFINQQAYYLLFDLDPKKNLRATLFDLPPRQYVLTSGGTGTDTYHQIELAADPDSSEVHFSFDGNLIASWGGIKASGHTPLLQFGSFIPTQGGSMNFQSIRFNIGLPLVALQGDYNNDGLVDAADFTVWRDTLDSTTNLTADGNLNGKVDLADFTLWRENFGQKRPGAGVASELRASDVRLVPEPKSFLLILLGALLLGLTIQRPLFDFALFQPTKP